VVQRCKAALKCPLFDVRITINFEGPLILQNMIAPTVSTNQPFVELNINNQTVRIPISHEAPFTITIHAPATGSGASEPNPTEQLTAETSVTKPLEDTLNQTVTPTDSTANTANETIQRTTDKLPPKLQALKTQYSLQCEVLAEKSFTNLRQNLQVLRKVNGNTDMAIVILEKRQRKNPLQSDKGPRGSPIEKRNQKFSLLEETYANQIAALTGKGFTKDRRLLNLLRRFDGDAEKVENFLNHKQAKLSEHPKFAKIRALESRYSDQLKALSDQGFDDHSKALKVLHRYGGNIEKTRNHLTKVEHKSFCDRNMKRNLK
jgi:hypothetical protein